MKKTIQTKRKPSGSNYRVLYAKTGRKRRLNAATTAAVDPHVELESDVPNVGIGRALLVILVLHIVAIAAIYIHSTFFGSEEEVSADSGNSGKTSTAAVASLPSDGREPTPAAAPVTSPAPVEDAGAERYIVVTGDTYQRIARVRNVDEQALRALNSNRPLRAGVVLDLPAELAPRPVAVHQNSPERRPDRAVVSAPKTERAENFSTVEQAVELDTSNAPRAIVVKPEHPAPVLPADGVKDSGKRYTIKSGDTLWRISSRFEVSRDAVLKLNGIKDPNKLYAGRTIKIPAE